MKTIIFGSGFTGLHLLKYFPDALSTELPELCSGKQIPLDFHDKATWKNIPEFDQAVITFKMTNQSLAQQFSKLFTNKKVILLSSARNLLNTKANEIISEENPLSENSRSSAEACFKSFSIVLYLGLLWGSTRNPSKWISQGRIKNGEKFINLIHVDDLCRIIVLLLKKEKKSNQILISDGAPIKWQKIAERSGLTLNRYPPGIESRRFNTVKLKTLIPNDFQFHKPEII